MFKGVNMKYEIRWKSYDFVSVREIAEKRIFDDVQWKDYGARVVNDENGDEFVIPYTSIYEVKIIREE
jgi:hypothetical protein